MSCYYNHSLQNYEQSPCSRGNGKPDCREDSVTPPMVGHPNVEWCSHNHHNDGPYNHSTHYHHHGSSWGGACPPRTFTSSRNYTDDSCDLLQRANKRQRLASCSDNSTTILTTSSTMTTSAFPPFLPLPSKSSAWSCNATASSSVRFHHRRYYLHDPSTSSSSQEEGYVPFPPDIQRLVLPSLLHAQFNELSQRRQQEYSSLSLGGAPLATMS